MAGAPRPRDDGDDADLVDPMSGFEAWRTAAARLDDWHHGGQGPRPPGHVRRHQIDPVPEWQRWWWRVFHRTIVDPGGRPRHLRRAGDL